jgi:hypothetical protein
MEDAPDVADEALGDWLVEAEIMARGLVDGFGRVVPYPVQRRIGSRSQAKRKRDDQKAKEGEDQRAQPARKTPAGIDNPPSERTAGCSNRETCVKRQNLPFGDAGEIGLVGVEPLHEALHVGTKDDLVLGLQQ